MQILKELPWQISVQTYDHAKVENVHWESFTEKYFKLSCRWRSMYGNVRKIVEVKLEPSSVRKRIIFLIFNMSLIYLLFLFCWLVLWIVFLRMENFRFPWIKVILYTATQIVIMKKLTVAQRKFCKCSQNIRQLMLKTDEACMRKDKSWAKYFLVFCWLFFQIFDRGFCVPRSVLHFYI